VLDAIESELVGAEVYEKVTFAVTEALDRR
jgi:hypothetical protein